MTKVNFSGASLAWSSYLGGADSEGGIGIAVDASGNAYVTGCTLSTDFPATGGFDTTFGGGEWDAFVTTVDASGASLAWSSYLGGAGLDVGFDIAVDADGNAYLTGMTDATDFPSRGGFDTSYGGGIDGFVAYISAPVCGDGACQVGETDVTCPADCPPGCGDSVCDPTSETCSTCAGDCGACPPPICGNGVIEAEEECEPPGTDLCDAACYDVTTEPPPGGCGCRVVAATPAPALPPAAWLVLLGMLAFLMRIGGRTGLPAPQGSSSLGVDLAPDRRRIPAVAATPRSASPPSAP